jgi:hypothetical protein
MIAISSRKIFAVFFYLVCFPTAGLAAESVEDFVDRVVAAYGGEAVLSRAGTVRQTGWTVSLKRGGATAAVTRLFQRPDKLRVEIAFPGERVEVRILDGPRGWRRGAKISGPMHGAMLLQAARIALPLLLLEERAKLEDLGTESGPGGAVLRILRLPLQADLALIVAIEVETGHIVHSRGIISAGDRPVMEFATTYADFRSWNGILVAGREEQYAMGRHVGHTLIEKVEILDSVNPEEFRP